VKSLTSPNNFPSLDILPFHSHEIQQTYLKIFAVIFTVLLASFSSTLEIKLLLSFPGPVAKLSHHSAASPASRFLAHQEVSAIGSTLGSVTHPATVRKPLQSPITTSLLLAVASRFLLTTAKLDKSDVGAPCKYINRCPDSILQWTNDSEEYYSVLCGIATDLTQINISIYCHDQVKHLRRSCLTTKKKKRP